MVLGDNIGSMPWFTRKHTIAHKVLYKEPERISIEDTRRNRVLAELTKQRKALEERGSLSPANTSHLNKLKEFEVKFGDELESRRKRLNYHIDSGTIRDAAGIRARLRYFQLLQRRQTLQQNAALEARRKQSLKVEKSFVNRAFVLNPRTIFGTDAHVKRSSADRQKFRSAALVVPCLERVVRREVMFARGHSGRAYRKRHRFGPLSLIGC